MFSFQPARTVQFWTGVDTPLLRPRARPQDAATHLRPERSDLKGVEYKDEGTEAFCKNLLALCKWHSEGMSVLSTGLHTMA